MTGSALVATVGQPRRSRNGAGWALTLWSGAREAGGSLATPASLTPQPLHRPLQKRNLDRFRAEAARRPALRCGDMRRPTAPTGSGRSPTAGRGATIPSSSGRTSVGFSATSARDWEVRPCRASGPWRTTRSTTRAHGTGCTCTSLSTGSSSASTRETQPDRGPSPPIWSIANQTSSRGLACDRPQVDVSASDVAEWQPYHDAMSLLPPITIDALKSEVSSYSAALSIAPIPALYGVTDGKALGTYVEHAFIAHLSLAFEFDRGNSAKGIDIPRLDIDIKVTSVRQPQSSCPFRDATQKVYGLGYGLLVFVYDKADDPVARIARLDILHAILIEKQLTADYSITRGLKQIADTCGDTQDLDAYLAGPSPRSRITSSPC